MKLYNTLSRRVEEFKPIHASESGVYTCGPTVYDYPHLGNWFTFIRYDLLIRTLKLSGYNPKWVMNITDVGHLVSDADDGEDKLEKGARREAKTAWEVADYYTDYFLKGLTRLNFSDPWQLPKATEHIKEQIDFIKGIEQKGYTYIISDGVYYDVSKFPAYKDFARLELDEQQSATRIDPNPEKRNPSDFALWKFSPNDRKRDMEWDSPWGKGFPGWHIECSAMSLKYLGETIDIHSGGIDHIPVHHTNEIAQSTALTGKPLANYWMHTNHILIGKEKIAKSLGNTITLEDITKRGIDLMAFRLHVIESHYRSQSKFSWEALAAAQQRLLRYKNWSALRFQTPSTGEDVGPPDLLAAMADDLNSAEALSRLEAFIDAENGNRASIASLTSAVTLVDELLGLKLMQVEDITPNQKDLIKEREQARQDNDWAKSDALREQLKNENIGINDRPEGPVWYYLT